jgi:hypothetical protein
VPRIGESVRQALGYWWDLVSGAVQLGLTTTETTSMAAQVAQELGGNVTFSESKSIAVLYGYASRMNNASTAFQNATSEQVITPNMVATPPWARELQEQATYPLYHVKFYYTYLDAAGNEQTDIKTSAISRGLPSTVGELTEQVQLDAEAFASKYGHQFISALPYQILEV